MLFRQTDLFKEKLHTKAHLLKSWTSCQQRTIIVTWNLTSLTVHRL